MMKALFSRFNRGTSKDKDRDATKDTPGQKEKPLDLPPLPEWPPQRATSTPNSVPSTFKPLPEVTVRAVPAVRTMSTDSTLTPISPTTPRPTTTVASREDEGSFSPNTMNSTTFPRSEQESVRPPSRKATNGSISTTTGISEAHKKVAFISPPPTPAVVERSLHDDPNKVPTPAGVPAKTTLSRFQATHGKDPRGSTTNGVSSSKTNVASSSVVSVKATSTRTATSPGPHRPLGDSASLHQSIRSGTPYSQMTNNSSSRILATASWSEGAEEDLVSNLGPRERTRQEVLWEIVASEERYVAELVKMKDTFIEPLLHPFSLSPVPSTPRNYQLDYDDYPRSDSPQESVDQLPIAARFMSPVGFRPETPTTPTGDRDKDTPNIDGESLDTDDEDEGDDRIGRSYMSSKRPSGKTSQAAKHNHPRSPYRSTATRTAVKSTGAAVPFPTRSHQSLPVTPRVNPNLSTPSLNLQHLTHEQDRERKHSQGQTTTAQGARVLRKFRKSQTTNDSLVNGAVAPHQLPDDLRICLETVESGIFDGHLRLSEGLRKRYDEQYPLVRSLADVFVTNSHLFHGYATYVLHLERALEQVDNALSNTEKKPKKQDAAEWLKVCKYLQKLEESAAEKGETGLAITLSKPFQRLLKYPLLFQNLLFHTDPSTFEYESTLQMVAEVETIVRSIEDEKIQKEERDKTRDVFARIEGLEKNKQLALPKPSRVLLEERLYMPTGANQQNGSARGASTPPSAMAVKGKTSFKRLSDVLHSSNGVGGKKDLWLVVFNDVVLQCQRTGTTSLPLVAATNSRTNSLPELQGKAKYATTGRKTAQTKPRNLYKFLKIETWAIGEVIKPREGVVSMEDVVRSRAQVHSTTQPRILPLPDEDEDDGGSSDHSDTKSKMSFSYWGADKVTIQKPMLKQRPAGAHGGPRRGGSLSPSSYGRESSANAKFGNRLISAGDGGPNAHRPASRRTQATPVARRPAPSEDANSAKATVTRPAWDSNTRSQLAPGAKRSRNTSQTSAATRVATTTTTNAKLLASPAPSEDSGVGLYRQIIAQDPSITETSSIS